MDSAGPAGGGVVGAISSATMASSAKSPLKLLPGQHRNFSRKIPAQTAVLRYSDFLWALLKKNGDFC